jgi:hypothetical protein
MSDVPTFRPAKPWGWLIRAVQTFLRFDLSWRDRLHLDPGDLNVLRGLPPWAGLILTPNHADVTDFKVCLDLSRRCGRRFLFMMNREAFDEGYGVAGRWLQRLGAFSVERGGPSNEEAKRHAIEAVKQGREVLVVFPEGEIYYLNDLVQPFKTGAVDIGMQAVVEARRTRPDWTAYVVPLALKYRYRKLIGPILERRIRRMERHLSLLKGGLTLRQRLARILADVLHRRELTHHLRPDPDRLAELDGRVREVREAILSQIEGKYAGTPVKPQAEAMNRAWRLSSYLRGLLTQVGRFGATMRARIHNDLAGLKGVAHMGSWQPRYVDVDPSQERLAEMVLKLEREVYRTGRPRQLARREVFLRVGEPIDLGRSVPDYLRDAHAVRHRIAEQLRDAIQALINAMASVTPSARAAEPDEPGGGPPGLALLGPGDAHQGNRRRLQVREGERPVTPEAPPRREARPR